MKGKHGGKENLSHTLINIKLGEDWEHACLSAKAGITPIVWI